MGTIKANKDVDEHYAFLRTRHGDKNPQANGYRLGSFFKRERRILLSAIDQNNGPFLDVACGSGLMLEPLLHDGHTVYGLDFNAEACNAARQNGITMLRGDAFNMPLPDNTIGQITNCQFLNQQTSVQTKKFIEESARVLKPGGQLIILWRHAKSLTHRSVHSVFTVMDSFTGQPPFPQYEHPMEELCDFAKQAGLEVKDRAVTLPFLKPDMVRYTNPAAAIFGASLFIVLKKP